VLHRQPLRRLPSLRAFSGDQFDQDTPDHFSLSIIRNRLGDGVYQSALELVLKGLRDHGLLKGRPCAGP
jgi:hypothetical protein